jgi:hypothetical protein
MISSGSQLGLIHALVCQFSYSDFQHPRIVLKAFGDIVKHFTVHELQASRCIWRFDTCLNALDIKLEEASAMAPYLSTLASDNSTYQSQR